MSPLLKRLADAYPQEVQTVFRHFPLSSHPLAFLAAEATEAAGAQGKFWEMEEQIFANQQSFASQSETDFRKTLDQFAQTIGLDQSKFNSDLDSGKYKAKVQAAQDLATQLGLGGTPFLLVNGEAWINQVDYLSAENLAKVVDYYKKRYSQAPAMQIDVNKQYFATVKMVKGGEFVIQLYPDKAPVTVNSFVFLAKQGFFDQL